MWKVIQNTEKYLGLNTLIHSIPYFAEKWVIAGLSILPESMQGEATRTDLDKRTGEQSSMQFPAILAIR